MKKIHRHSCLFLLSLVIFAGYGKAAESSVFDFPQQDFDSPEAAIQHFVKSVANNSLEEALKAFAINEYADKFQFEKFSNWLGAIQPIGFLAPAQYPVYAQINRLKRVGEIAGYIKNFVYSFIYSEDVEFGLTIAPVDDKRISRFVSSVNPQNLAKLSIKEIASVGDSNEKLQKSFAVDAMNFGASEGVERVVLYELSGVNFIGGFKLYRYKKAWRINQLGSSLANLPGSGVVTKATSDEFHDLVERIKAELR